MKKTRCLLVFILIILLSSCENTIKSDTTMTIRPSKFSKETQNALKIFDAETLFLDYTINDTVKYISINLWIY
ncbi:hypothetical protein, partial [Anaerotignum sp.]|uniref:hypothetical protein n=1 Tax=Anaerotignum sp. TaxID=2039241 RepID=UPI00289A06B5